MELLAWLLGLAIESNDSEMTESPVIESSSIFFNVQFSLAEFPPWLTHLDRLTVRLALPSVSGLAVPFKILMTRQKWLKWVHSAVQVHIHNWRSGIIQRQGALRMAIRIRIESWEFGTRLWLRSGRQAARKVYSWIIYNLRIFEWDIVWLQI